MPPKRTDPRPRGLRCPHCNTVLQVSKSLALVKGVIKRRRFCPVPGCPYLVTTYERPAG